jgi:putative inorganic carbon (hco3(-)) transporter
MISPASRRPAFRSHSATVISAEGLLICASLTLLALLLTTAPIKWIALGLTSSAVSILILLRPAVGLVAVAAAIPFGGFLPTPSHTFNGVDMLVALVVATWLARGVADRRIVFTRPPLTWPLLIFLWCAALSLTQATSWREGLPEWLKWAEFAALYLVATQILSKRSALWVLIALLIAGAAQAALGIYQFWQQTGPEAFVLQGGFMRAYGTFQQPNPYAGYLGYLFPVVASLGLGAFGQWQLHRSRIHLALFAGCSAVAGTLAIGIILSWSRGAWLGLIAGAGTVLVFRSRRSAIIATGIAILGLLAILLFGMGWMPQTIMGRIGVLGSYLADADPGRTEITDANFAVLERLAHWQAGQRMFGDHPWLGVGIGNYASAYETYALPHWYVPLGHAHNVFINFLAETGAIGFLAFMIFWLGVAWLAWRSAAHTVGYGRALGVGILGMWIYLSVHSLFDNLFVQHMQLQLALLMAMLVQLTAADRKIPRYRYDFRLRRKPQGLHAVDTQSLS